MSEAGSPSLARPNYWWYRARADLLETTLRPFVEARGSRPRILDVGSADGPSVSWLRDLGERVGMDIDPRGLAIGDVCGSALNLPFATSSIDVVAAFDVIEHCEPQSRALAEVYRILVPGGLLLMSVPAYEWAWTSHDDHNHHYRRYTRRRAVEAVSGQGFEVMRATYMFTGTFPFFAADRGRRRLSERRSPKGLQSSGEVPGLPDVAPWIERALLRLSAIDGRILRKRDLPFGSSVVVAAQRPTHRG